MTDVIKQSRFTAERGQVAAQIEDYQALINVAQVLSSEPDVDRLLNLVIDETNRLLHADRTSLFLVDGETDELYSKIALGLGVNETIRVKKGSGLAGYVAATGELVNVEDVATDDRFNSSSDKKGGYHTKSLLTVPLKNHKNIIIGVLQAINKTDGVFTRRDEEVAIAFASLATIAIENATMRRDIERMFDSFIVTMARTIDARDTQTAGHSERVAFYARLVALKLGFSEEGARVVEIAGLLHDYGKIGVPEAILTKPGSFTPEERAFIEQHVVKSEEILKNIYLIGALKRIPLIVGQHHERVNGKGYPRKLKGNEITLEGRILAVSDVYDALTVRRYYREPMSSADALKLLYSEIGIHFDEECVEALEAVVLEVGAPQRPEEDGASLNEQFALRN
jgi:HD-GYP domain-containing protein (c-di-GMP phosphodiesterase class II)